MDVAERIHPDKKTGNLLFALSRATLQRRKDDITQQLNLSLQVKVNKEKSLFSLAMDGYQQLGATASVHLFSVFNP